MCKRMRLLLYREHPEQSYLRHHPQRTCNMSEVQITMKENNVVQKDCSFWGYVVCFGTTITFVAGIGHVNSFGLIYKDFIMETNSTAKSLTTAHGVFAIMLAIGGIILNILTKSLSLRFGGLIGAAVFSLGSLSTVFISNTDQLSLTFGILQGIGFGMMVPVSYSTINRYFVEKRTTIMSLIKAAQGLVLMWYPQFIKQIVHHFGFRGTLLIISGISLHTFPGMLVMKMDSNIPTIVRTVRTANGAKCHKIKTENEDLLRKQNEEAQTKIVKNTTAGNLKQKLLDFLNLKVLKDPVYRNICLGQSFVNFSDLTFFILQPMLLFQYGYTTSEVTTCISICAGADVAGRCGLAVISSITRVNTRLLFYTATLLTFVFRIVILQIQEFTGVAAVTATLGVLRAWLHIASPLVISDHVTHNDFPGAYAVFMLTAGLVNVICSPIIGLLKDIYEDYVPAFYALAACCLPCLLTWSIEYLYKFNINS